jgi:small-conductance mechanosensitive channel
VPEKRSATTITEFALLILTVVAYFIIKTYPSITTAIYYRVVLSLLLQLALGVAAIILICWFMGLYGYITDNERELHDFIRVLRLIAYPILIIILLQTLNISIASLLVGAGFLGIVVGLAAQTSLGNAFAGISIMYSNPFKAGDKITFNPTSFSISAPTHPHETMMSEITGTVRRVGLIYTKLMKDDMSLLYIPNAALNQGIIQNQSRMHEKLVRVRLGVKRHTDVEFFREKLIADLSENKEEFEKLRDLQIKLGLVSSEDDLGIIVTAAVKILDYDRLSQWVSQTAVSALIEVQQADSIPTAKEDGTKSKRRIKGKKSS